MMKILEKAGWSLDRITGSHHHFSHPARAEIITVPFHRGDLKKGLERAILKKAGL